MQLRFLRIFSRCFLRKFLPTNLFLIVQTSVTLTIISPFKYWFFSFFFICSFFLFCFFLILFFFGFAFSLLAFLSFFSFSPLMYLLSFLFSLIFLFKLVFCYFSWDRSIPQNRLKRRKSRKKWKISQILNQTKRNINKFCLGKISHQKTVRTKISIKSWFSNMLYGKKWKPENTGNQQKAFLIKNHHQQ